MKKTPTQQLIELRFNQPIDILLRDRFEQGHSLETIGEELGVSWQSINAWARKYRIPPRKPGRKRRPYVGEVAAS
ncbi:MAG: hypothetical protein H0U60_13190 [Blastocatellia bacterium]|nr:hypothetical protein [Blastocatellia bacterium]